MKEKSENKNQYKAVEDKEESPKFGAEKKALIASKDFRISSSGQVFKVKKGDDVSNLPEDKINLLKTHGVI